MKNWLSPNIYKNGTKKLLAFHGFGQNPNVFSKLKNTEIHSFSLFGHHKDDYQTHFGKEIWEKEIGEYLHQNFSEKISIIAFSIGAKPALSILDRYPEKIDKITLVAPEGISLNFWYKAATKWFSYIFRLLVNSPNMLKKIIILVKKTRLLPKQTIQLAYSQVGNSYRNKRLLHTWMGYKDFRFNTKELVEKCSRHNIEIQFIIGKNDSVIRQKHIDPFYKPLKSKSIRLISGEHSTLLHKYIELLNKSF